MRNIREEKGYTYSPGSALTGFADAGFYRLNADVRNEVTGPTLAEVFKEIDLLRSGGSDGAELQGAKSYLRGIFPIQTSTQNGLAATLNNCAGFDTDRIQMAQNKICDSRNCLQIERLQSYDQLFSQCDRFGVSRFVIIRILQRINGGKLGGKAYHPGRCDRA